MKNSTKRIEERNRQLRWMIAEVGVDTVLQELSAVCKGYAEDQKSPKWANVWYDRASELKSLSEKFFKPAGKRLR